MLTNVVKPGPVLVNGTGVLAAVSDSPSDGLARVASMVAEIENIFDPYARELIQKCLMTVMDIHGVGLQRMLEIINDAGAQGQVIRESLLRDKIVSGLLLIHGMHPQDVETRLRAALATVGDNVELVRIDDGVAKVRLHGISNSCAPLAISLGHAIQQAVSEACPELIGLEVEGVVPASGEATHVANWVAIEGLRELPELDVRSIEIEGVQMIVCRYDGRLFAYRNECPACGLPIETRRVADGTLSCRLGHHFEVAFGGRSTDNASLHLEPFPLLDDAKAVKIAVM